VGKTRSITRRQFLRGAAAAVGGFAVIRVRSLVTLQARIGGEPDLRPVVYLPFVTMQGVPTTNVLLLETGFPLLLETGDEMELDSGG
jgi:hypothetical protein